MSHNLTEYELFEQSSTRNKRLLCEEGLILDVTEAVSSMMQDEDISKTELAKRMGRTKGFITQLLSGDRNLTLRTLAGVADALGSHVTITLSKDRHVRVVKRRRQIPVSLLQKPIKSSPPAFPLTHVSADEMDMGAAA